MVGKYIEKVVTPNIGEFTQLTSEQDSFELPPVIQGERRLEISQPETPGTQ